MARRALDALSRAAFAPHTASSSFVTLLALAPPVLAGLFLFGLPAARMLVLAVAVGAAVHVVARQLRQPIGVTPVVPALIGVALLGPGTSLPWVGGVALIGAGLEVTRARFLPSARVEPGLISYTVAILVTRGALAQYLAPHSISPMADPIRLWLQYYGGGQAPIDTIRLYVGNVPGPVFATSVLALLIGGTWFWYARRLNLLVVLTFGVGALVSVALMRWSIPYHLTSGPLWFTAALVLANRRQLPASAIGRPLLGFTAGILVMAARVRGFGIESIPVTVAVLQLVVALVDGVAWLVPNRDRLRQVLRTVRAPGLSPRGLIGKFGPS